MIATSEQLGKNFDDLLTEACKVHLCVCMHFEPVPRDSLGYSAVYMVCLRVLETQQSDHIVNLNHG